MQAREAFHAINTIHKHRTINKEVVRSRRLLFPHPSTQRFNIANQLWVPGTNLIVLMPVEVNLPDNGPLMIKLYCMYESWMSVKDTRSQQVIWFACHNGLLDETICGELWRNTRGDIELLFWWSSRGFILFSSNIQDIIVFIAISFVGESLVLSFMTYITPFLIAVMKVSMFWHIVYDNDVS